MLIYALMKGKASSAAAKALKNTYGNDVVNEKTCRRWLSRFKRDDLSLKDERQTESRMLKKTNSEQLEVTIDENTTCTRELSKTFNVSPHMTIYREMKRREDKVSKAGKWAPTPT
ncbi:hypothetical protein ACTXT7_009890 [Hymenolepis weldensis]